MPEETSTPNEPTKRRSTKPSAEESGGKILPIILLVLVLGLGFALFKRNGSANEQAESDARSIASISNQVSELRTKLALEQSNLGVAQTNHLAAISRRTSELMTASNRLVQTSLLFDHTQQETRAAQGELPARVAAIATLEAQRDELQRQAAVIPNLQSEVAELKEKLNQARFAQASLYDTLGRVRLELADLERNLEDPLFLHLQERRVVEAAEIRQRAAAKQPVTTSDPRVRLELLPDGTVRPAIAASAQPRK